MSLDRKQSVSLNDSQSEYSTNKLVKLLILSETINIFYINQSADSYLLTFEIWVIYNQLS